MVLVPVPVPHKLELGTDSGLVLEKKKKNYGSGFSSHSEDQTQFWLSQTRTDEYHSTFTSSKIRPVPVCNPNQEF